MKVLYLLATAGLVLYIIPPLKTVYDTLMTNFVTGTGLPDFTMAVLSFGPLIMPGILIFGVIYKLFHRKSPPGVTMMRR